MPTPVTVLDHDNGETRHARPVFLPDGRHFIFLAMRGLQPRGTFIGALDSNAREPLIEGAANTTFARGFVVFVKGSALMAQAFDPDKRVLVGDAGPLVEQFRLLPDGTAPFWAAEHADVLIYGQTGVSETHSFRVARSNPNRQAIASDRSCRPLLGRASEPGWPLFVRQRWSGGRQREIWIIDALRNTRAPFTDDPGAAFGQVWSGDGTRMAYMSTRNGRFDLYEKVVATGQERVLFTDGAQKFVHDWSNDGRYLIYSEGGQAGNSDLWVLPLAANAKPIAFQPSRAAENYAQFSHDVKWIAFQSNDSGRSEVYVAPFPGRAGGCRFPATAGSNPVGTSMGGNFLPPTGWELMAVAVKTAADKFDRQRAEHAVRFVSGMELRAGAMTCRLMVSVSSSDRRIAKERRPCR